MSRNGPNMEGQTARFLIQRGITDFGGPNRGGGGRGGMYGRGGGRQFLDRDKPGFQFPGTMNRTIQRKNRVPFLNRVDDSGDVIMDGEKPTHSRAPGSNVGISSRGGKKWRRLHKDGQQNHNKPRHHTFGPTWHKIFIYNGAQYDKEFVLTALRNACDVTFQPVAYTPLGSNVVFFVEDRRSAEALADCSGRITAPDTSKIEFRVDGCAVPPTATIDEVCLDKIRGVLSYRYNPSPPSLNLSAFHSSPELITDYYLPLIRPSVVEKIFTILQPALADLIFIDISNNKLSGLEDFRRLTKVCPNLRGLNLKNNRIRDMQQLLKLEGLDIHELILEGNPMSDKFSRDRTKYVSAVRKYFPKLTELDGVAVPPSISFDLEDAGRIPQSKPSFFCNEEAKKVALTFVEQYIAIYDSENRNPLLDAYHDDACMSLHCAYSKRNVSTDNLANRLSKYFEFSRNLLRSTDNCRQGKCLHEGKVNIIAFLNKLPGTIHDLHSFTIDMPMALDSLITFTLSGVFKEKGDTVSSIRAFQRTFNLVPQNQGFCIVNELLFITNATHAQSKAAFKIQMPGVGVAPTPSTSPVPQVPGPSPQSVVPGTSGFSEAETRRQMITQFSAQSGMNEDWSSKCLEDNDWDYEKGARTFMELQKSGMIPPEAFVKTNPGHVAINIV